LSRPPSIGRSIANGTDRQVRRIARDVLRFGTAGAAALGCGDGRHGAGDDAVERRRGQDGGQQQSFVRGRPTVATSLQRRDNLVVSDTNPKTDCFVKDTVTGAVTRERAQAASRPTVRAAGGRLKDRITAAERREEHGNGDLNLTATSSCTTRASETTRISVDSFGTGERRADRSSCRRVDVAYSSSATNLVVGDQRPVRHLRHEVAGTTTRVSVDSGGVGGNGQLQRHISADGNCIFFYGDATNLVAATLTRRPTLRPDRSAGVGGACR
jgi:hypothetical protein